MNLTPTRSLEKRGNAQAAVSRLKTVTAALQVTHGDGDGGEHGEFGGDFGGGDFGGGEFGGNDDNSYFLV